MPLSNLFRGLKGRKINFLIIKKIGCRGISLQGLEIGILQWSIHPRIPSILFCRNLTDNPKPSCSQRVTEFFKNTVGKGCVIDLFIYLFIFYYISDSSHPSILSSIYSTLSSIYSNSRIGTYLRYNKNLSMLICILNLYLKFIDLNWENYN